SSICSMDVPGLVSTCISICPSSADGINSAPKKGISARLATMTTTVPKTIDFRYFNTPFNTLRYPLFTQSKKRLNHYSRPWSSIHCDNSLEDNIGTKVTATMSDVMSEKDTVNAKGVNKSEAIPSTYTIGKKTTNVVVVEAITAGASSDAPLIAASTRL